MIGVKLINSDNGEIVDFKVLPENGQWPPTFADLDRLMFSENGLAVPIPYMAEEEPVSGYSAVVERPEEGSFKITNTLHWIDRFYASVLWDDQDDEDGRRPSSVALHLMKMARRTGMRR
ncbi:MAG: Cna B-type domain-containing protein [Clostridia bacterium]|nr:Cna B-type domain-containing protein [Clostridia bacterium]